MLIFANMKNENCFLIIVLIEPFNNNQVEHVFQGLVGISLLWELPVLVLALCGMFLHFEFPLE